MPSTASPYRFLLISAFDLAPTGRYQMRPRSGPKEMRLMNYESVEPALRGVDWELHPGPVAPHGDWPVETREEFVLVGAARLPIVKEACDSGKFNGIALLGGGDPCFLEAREIGHRYGVPVTSCAHSQMHLASMLGDTFSIIDISEIHNMRMRDLVTQYGFANRCTSIRNINYPLPHPPYDDEYLLEAEKAKAVRGEPADIIDISMQHCIEAIEEDGAETLIIGCSALYWLRPILQQKLHEEGWQIPVLEGYRSAVEHLKLLVNLGISASSLSLPVERTAKWRRKKRVI